jgi:carbonic anhydrase/acetyltransferase-like protein (isoleucine patch superfamily)
MTLYALGDLEPDVADDVFIHPAATVIGHVTIGPRSSIWPGAIIRGDLDQITIGEDCTIEDGSVLHSARGKPVVIGNGCVVGHLALLDACRLGNHVLVGSGAVVLQEVVLEDNVIVAANSIVPRSTVVPSGQMAIGVPARVQSSTHTVTRIKTTARVYVELAARYRTELRALP